MATGTLDSSNVRVAVTGAWYKAPSDTEAPEAADESLPADWVNLGYLSEDGTTRTTDRSNEDIKAWQNGALVRTVVTDASVSYQFTLIETTKATVELYTGATVDEDGTYDVDPSKTGGRQSFIFDVIDGDHVVRIYIPDGEVTEVGDQTFAGGDAVGYDITIKAYASAVIDGNTERVFRPALATAGGGGE
ncbi:hypothetical protein [Microbacterium sp. MPKO10]|uniref:phage tail tube protein n=1 Tax=Microbacterium sp. MPKO10 TaxID=2989818 RepID=UPI002236AA28|nr:hypothetical protein [Microbacterium sp. MPKO10]MCW4458186.1 hypothetical protein [Microbacterium sp. MPKO10]